MAVESKILQLSKPTIPIDELSMDDLQKFESSNNNNSSSSNQTTKGDSDRAAPDKSPLVKIRDYIFLTSEIDFLKITIGKDFLPTLICTITPEGGLFLSRSMPKDGDLISFFVASKSNEFKPVRIDFEIQKMSSMPSVDSQANINTYTFNGMMRVPYLYGEWNKSFNSTSLDALKSVADEAQLGFATNEVSTNDKMSWINPFDTWKKFIDDITISSWKDQDSFYTSFVDQYYNLNFVNVNNQFAGEDVIDQGFIKSLFQNRKTEGDTPQTQDQTSLVLSNLEAARNTNFYIESYTVLNKSGEVVLDNGYGRYMQFYSSDTKKYYSDQLIEPINNTKGSDMPLRGRHGENYQNEIRKYKWMGIERAAPNGNYHENYLYAKIHNIQNNDEVKKMTLYIQLQSVNFNFYRFQRIPVVITTTDNPQKNEANNDNNQNLGNTQEDPKASSLTIDPILSGFYVIDEITYIYDDNTFKQTLKLLRREWPLSATDQPANAENDPANI